MTRPYQTDGDVERRPIFTLRLAGKPGMAGIHALRALLKRYGFGCVDAHEETDNQERSS
jgi:hypothetical protein